MFKRVKHGASNRSWSRRVLQLGSTSRLRPTSGWGLQRGWTMGFSIMFALAVSGVGLVASPAAGAAAADASTQHYFSEIKDLKLAGIVIQYRDGVKPIANDGQMTAANFAGVALKPGRPIGQNMFSARFASKLSKFEIAKAMANLSRSPKVSMVAPDQFLEFAELKAPVRASLSPSAQLLSPTQRVAGLRSGFNTVIGSTLRAASAVRSLKAVDAFNSSQPSVPQLSLSWLAPASLYKAKVFGYEVQQSLDAGKTFRVLVANTKSTQRKYTVTQNIAAGVASSYRVRAITKLGSVSKLGLLAKPVSATPTGLPQAPVLVGTDKVINGVSPTWLPQNSTQRGGLAVTYQAIASSPGLPDSTCSPASEAAFSCTFSDLQAGHDYTAVIKVTNIHGSAVSLPVATVTDPLFAQQWYLSGQFGINAPNAWSITKGSYLAGSVTKRVTVAVIDTGYTAHPDLNAQYVRTNGAIAGYDFVSDPSSAHDGNSWDSDAADNGDYSNKNNSSWHATHVSGLIAAEANNGVGITGVAPGAQILPVRALGALGGTSSDLAAAINWSIGLAVPSSVYPGQPNVATPPINPNPAQVINISMGTSSFTPCDNATQAAVTAAVKKNVTIVTAAGNSLGQAIASYPGNCFGTINVGATSSVGDRTVYSNYGAGVDVSAPGGDSTQTANTSPEAAGQILSDLNAGAQGPTTPTYGYDEGTSMASPLVAGTVALMYAAHPTITFDQAATIIIDTASKFNSDPNLTFNADTQTNSSLNYLGHCYAQAMLPNNVRPQGWCGAGIVNAAAAVAAAAALP